MCQFFLRRGIAKVKDPRRLGGVGGREREEGREGGGREGGREGERERERERETERERERERIIPNTTMHSHCHQTTKLILKGTGRWGGREGKKRGWRGGGG